MQIGRSGTTCPLTARIDAEARPGITGLRLRMIRTVWLAMMCLAVLSTLAVGKALMTRADYPVAERRTDQATVGTCLIHDTGHKTKASQADRPRQEEQDRRSKRQSGRGSSQASRSGEALHPARSLRRPLEIVEFIAGLRVVGRSLASGSLTSQHEARNAP